MLLNNHSSIKFSIIVPVYNAEKYLERCLSSLLSQDLGSDEYEVIAINDGSIDSSEEILKKQSRVHSNLIWKTTANRGVSEARNYGCQLARGAYLLFVDSDDYVQPAMLQSIWQIVEKEKLDILVMDYTYWDEKGTKHRYSEGYQHNSLPAETMEGKKFMIHCLPQVVWCSAYSSDFWRKNKLTFLPIRHEDEEILPRIFYFADKVLFKPINFYTYVRNPDSFMMNYDEKACNYLVQAMKSVDLFRKQNVKEEAMDMYFRDFIASRLLSAIVLGVKGGVSQASLMNIISEMKKSHLSPLPKGKKGFHKFLFRFLPSWYVAYYRFKKGR